MTSIPCNLSSGKAARRERYDGVSILLHWLTALLVITLFGLAQGWHFAAPHSELREGMENLHISLGITLAATILFRVFWRFSRQRRPALPVGGVQAVAAHLMHGLLYLLVVAQVVIGFLWHWSYGAGLSFFGLFSLEPPFTLPVELRGLLHELHETNAWIIISLAGLHALAALMHHYVLKDGLIRRMMPGRVD
jgi:cytochrome b561